MSVTKDGDTGRWMSQIRVTDWTGKTIHKKKRGFATKKEALQWERDFISQSTGSLGTAATVSTASITSPMSESFSKKPRAPASTMRE